MKKNVFCLSYYPWKRSKTSKCGTYGLVGVLVFSQRLDLMISEVFSELYNSRLCPRRCSFQAGARAVPCGGRVVGMAGSPAAGGLRSGDGRS